MPLKLRLTNEVPGHQFVRSIDDTPGLWGLAIIDDRIQSVITHTVQPGASNLRSESGQTAHLATIDDVTLVDFTDVMAAIDDAQTLHKVNAAVRATLTDVLNHTLLGRALNADRIQIAHDAIDWYGEACAAIGQRAIDLNLIDDEDGTDA